jgi:hypothetical protein
MEQHFDALLQKPPLATVGKILKLISKAGLTSGFFLNLRVQKG